VQLAVEIEAREGRPQDVECDRRRAAVSGQRVRAATPTRDGLVESASAAR
jgi:hypothetical protein